ncbi:MAG: hypothetical protein AAF401_04990 [Pseudomonadota bacterium]
MLSQDEFLTLLWSRLTPRIAEYTGSAGELAAICNKSRNYITSAQRTQAEIGVYALYALTEALKLDPAHVLGREDKVYIPDTSVRTEQEHVEQLLETAMRLAKIRAEANQPPTLDRIISDWRRAERTLARMDPKVLEFCDIYAPPTAEGRINVVTIGPRGLMAEALSTTEVDVLNRNLAALDPEISRATIAVQQDVLDGRYVLVEKQVSTPLVDGRRVSIVYDQLNLPVTNADDEKRVLVYAKKVGDLE